MACNSKRGQQRLESDCRFNSTISCSNGVATFQSGLDSVQWTRCLPNGVKANQLVKGRAHKRINLSKWRSRVCRTVSMKFSMVPLRATDAVLIASAVSRGRSFTRRAGLTGHRVAPIEESVDLKFLQQSTYD